MAESHPTVVTHGGVLHDELAAAGIRESDVLDLSVNVNPYGPHASVRRAIAGAAIHRYPDPNASLACRALAHQLGVAPARVTVGNGAVDLLWTIARAYLRPGDRVALVEPTFSEMRTAATRAGAAVLEHRTRPQDDFAVELGALDTFLHEVRPRLLYLCTPSNPAGVCTPRPGIEEIAVRHPGTLFVVDISFLSMSTRHADGDGPLADRIVWVRSLTKDHSLAGLRVGCAVAPAEIIARIEAERPPWSVNALAQAAAIAVTAADAQRFVDESRKRLLENRAYLTDALRAVELRVHPSETIYVLVDLGQRVLATDLRRRLLHGHRVLVRDATSFGLPHHVRIAARPRADTDRAVLALQRELRS